MLDEQARDAHKVAYARAIKEFMTRERMWLDYTPEEVDDNCTLYDCRTGQRVDNLTYAEAFELVEQQEAARVWRCNRCGREVVGRIEYIFCACGGELMEKEGSERV